MNSPITLKTSAGKDSHFTTSEFACKCEHNCTYKIPEVIAKTVKPLLIDRLEELRRRRGNKPIIINSGLRCNDYQRELIRQGLTKTPPEIDDHCLGRGADVADGELSHIDAASEPLAMQNKYEDMAIGWKEYETFVHIAVGRLAAW